MKGTLRRWEPKSADSVIATLMGFDELQPQRPFHEKRRVLSESYMRKVSSITLRPGSLVSVKRSCSANDVFEHGSKGVSGVWSSKGENDNVLDERMNPNTSNIRKDKSPKPADDASVSKSLSGDSYEDRKSFGKTGRHCATRHVLRYQQKLEHDLGNLLVDSMNKSLNSQMEMKDKTLLVSTSISGFKPKLRRVACDLEVVKFDIHSRQGYREHGKSLMHKSQKPYHEFTSKDPVVNSIVSPGHSCIACARTMNRISPQEKRRSKFEEVSEPGYKNFSHDLNLLINQSPLSNESKKQTPRRWKPAKVVQEFGASGRNQTLNKMFALATTKLGKEGRMPSLMPQNLDVRLGRNDSCSPSSLQSRISDSCGPSNFSSIDVAYDDSLKTLPVFEYEPIKGILSNGWKLKLDEPTARDNKSKVQATLPKDILEPKSERGSEQCQTSLDVDYTVSPSSEAFGLSSGYFSCFGSSYNNPEAYIQGIQDEINSLSENDKHTEIEPSQRNSKSSISNLVAQYRNDASYACAKEFNVQDSSTISEDLQSRPGILLEERDHSSSVEEVFSREASLNEFSEGESAYSNCSGIGPPESLENLKRTNQHSPNSILEPYDIKCPPFECFDSIGLRLQLQALDFELEETCSEGSMMFVSGDEDSEEQSGDLPHDGRKVKRWLGDDERRNYSYLVDVLDEAGLCDMNSFMDFNAWYSLECPISSLVFDTLEKKHGKQTSWEKYERQLLFDCINSGLLGIFDPVINFHRGATSLRRIFCSSFRRDEFEDELWMMLISQEKEKSKELSEKALEKWLELEEGINIICGELESSLFNELAVELASLWS